MVGDTPVTFIGALCYFTLYNHADQLFRFSALPNVNMKEASDIGALKRNAAQT